MDANYAWNVRKSPDRISRWTWRAEEVGGAVSPHEYVGISPVGFLEKGRYVQLVPTPLDYLGRLADCAFVHSLPLFNKCHEELAHDLFPELSPITSLKWFYRGKSRKVETGAAYLRAIGKVADSPDYPPWRTFLFMTHPFAVAQNVPTGARTVGFRKFYPPWAGDIVTTNARATSHALVPIGDETLERAILEKAVAGWWAELDCFRRVDLAKISPDKRIAYENDLRAAEQFLSVAKPRQTPFVTVSTPDGGRFANKLFVVGWGKLANFWFDPTDVYSIAHSPFELTAALMLTPEGYRIVRSGLSIGDEIRYLQSLVGSVLESPEGDFFVYTESGIHSPSRNLLQADLARAEQVIDRINDDGDLSRIGFLQGNYDQRYNRVIGK